MVEKIGHIKNPLTVIAIFAGIAEISGTIVLPFIAAANQATYIWFLMLFPFFLVSVFFLTLNFNHKKLYSPSDYKDENNFINPIAKATPQESEEKFKQEVKEVEADLKTKDSSKTEQSTGGEIPEPEKNEENKQVNSAQNLSERKNCQVGLTAQNNVTKLENDHDRVGRDVALAERLAVSQLTKELAIPFKSNARLNLPNIESKVFTALGVHGNIVHALEVKVFPGKNIDLERLLPLVKEARSFKDALEVNSNYHDFVLHIYAVTNASDWEFATAKNYLLSRAAQYAVRLNIHKASFNDLINMHQYG